MKTIYDWVTVALFAGLIVLFLQRSASDTEPQDHLWQYLIASIGCAVANYLGNHGNDILAVITLLATIGYVVVVLKPFQRTK